MLRTTVPRGGGARPIAISIAYAEAWAWPPPQAPQAREEMKMASRGSRPIRMTSYPRKRVACDRASRYRWFLRSATTWTASAPATRVTGSMFSDLMCPLRAISFWICSSRFSSVCSTGGRTVVTEYGSRTPRLMRALPALSNVMGRFLKHMAFRSFVRAAAAAASSLVAQASVAIRPFCRPLPPHISRPSRPVGGAAHDVVELVTCDENGVVLGLPPALHVPAHLSVQIVVGVLAQRPNESAEGPGSDGRHGRSRWPPVEGGELVGEARHGAANAGPTGVHAAPVVVDRPAGGDVAVDDGPPASDLHEALSPTEVAGKTPLLVVGTPNAVPVNRLAEQPCRAPQLVDLRQGPEALEVVEEARHGFREVVADGGAARDVDDRQPQRALVILAEEVHQAHGSRRIALGGGHPAPGCTRPDREGDRRPGGHAGDPLIGRDRAHGAIGSPGHLPLPGPVAAGGERRDLVAHGPFQHDGVRSVERALKRLLMGVEVPRSGFDLQHRVMDDHPREPRMRAQEK